MARELQPEHKYRQLSWPLALLVFGGAVLLPSLLWLVPNVADSLAAPTPRDWCELITPQAQIALLPRKTATAVARKLAQLATAEARANHPGNPQCLSTARPIIAVTETPTPHFLPPQSTPATG